MATKPQAADSTELDTITNKAAFDPSKIKVLKNVTLPQWKWKEDKAHYFTVKGSIFQAKEITGGRKPVVKEGVAPVKPPELMEVVNLETGELVHLIAGTVLATELREQYPNDTYVGKSFSVTKNKIADNKRYATYSITEIEV